MFKNPFRKQPKESPQPKETPPTPQDEVKSLLDGLASNIINPLPYSEDPDDWAQRWVRQTKDCDMLDTLLDVVDLPTTSDWTDTKFVEAYEYASYLVLYLWDHRFPGSLEAQTAKRAEGSRSLAVIREVLADRAEDPEPGSGAA